ncbi:alpha/beta hydrolase family protein [Nitrospirillum iridis]|uniref:Putative alpha/beta hydrolase n=1 Tax=Nitrospirillum iridis TaxID=765888 RepID=A0A7X0ECI8_9PROT|nr:alpha/beta fold hydrolase [Nitrospirillum iridis]MBB6251772.1 putative alpha/beta hydrolase [Nitrospirillum iridis]
MPVDKQEQATGEQAMGEQAVRITTPDGAQLAGRLMLPPAVPTPEIAIVIHGATGVPRDYYARFAVWLAGARDAAVLTYDYRDFGASAAGPVRHSDATMAVWGVVDQAAALDYLCDRFPDAEIWVVGHSLGGMCLPFHANAGRVARLIAVASGPAHWTKHPWRYTPSVIAFWFLLGPLATRLWGYLPGRLLGLGADLPKGVFWQWRRWCTSRGFYRVDWGRAMPHPMPDRMTGAVTLVGIADDEMMPPERVRRLADFYPAATIRHRVITPAEAGVKAIGHLRLFAERNAQAWPLLLEGAV